MKALCLSVFILIVTALAIASELPRVPKTPAACDDLVFIRPFTLANGYKYDWSKDHPIVTSGTLVVLKVAPELVFPRNSAEPVLYAGNQAAQRLNQGYESGHVIAIIPGEVDLSRVPIWFGSPQLPERIDADTIKSERTLADAAKIRPFAAEKVHMLEDEPLEASDLFSLLRDHVADLVLEFSPQEKHLVDTWRLPVAKPLPAPQ